MTYDEKLTARVREALARLPKVEEKRMFSGITFMVNGKMCVGVHQDKLMCRIDPGLHAEAVKRKGAKAMDMKGREYKGFVFVSGEGMKSKKDFDYWIGLALDFNKGAKSSKKKNEER